MLLRFLRRSESGNVAVIFALTLVPVLGLIGAAVDYSMVTKSRSDLQAVADAAALAGAALPNATDDERIAEVHKFLDSNEAADFDTPSVSIEGDRVVVTLGQELPTSLMHLLDVDTFNVSANSEALIPGALTAEIALVLDYSGSMNGSNKYQTMRDATIDLINGLDDASSANTIKFGLVPFSEYVYTDMTTDYIRDIHSSYFGSTVRACLDSRRYPYAVQSSTPNSSVNASRWPAPGMPNALEYPGSTLPSGDYLNDLVSTVDCTPPPSGDDDDDGGGTYVPNDYCLRTYTSGEESSQQGEIVVSDFASVDPQCANYRDKDVRVRPLTTDYASLIGQLEFMTPIQLTNIALGLEFGWHILTPNAPYMEGEVPDDDVIKAIVLLTDGRQTVGGFGPSDSFNIGRADQNTEALCASIKDDDILLITVAFDLNHVGTRDRLRDCASETEFFFEADTNSELVSVFHTIMDMFLTPVRLVK